MSGLFKRCAASRRSQPVVCPRLEALESRDNPAATLDPSTHVVTVEHDRVDLYWYDVFLDTGPGLVRVVENGVTYEFPQGDVAGIQIDGTLAGPWPSVFVEHLLASTPLTVNSLFGDVYLSPIACDLDNVAGRIDLLGT